MMMYSFHSARGRNLLLWKLQKYSRMLQEDGKFHQSDTSTIIIGVILEAWRPRWAELLLFTYLINMP